MEIKLDRNVKNHRKRPKKNGHVISAIRWYCPCLKDGVNVVELTPRIFSVVIMSMPLELTDAACARDSGHGNEVIAKRRIKGMVLSVQNEDYEIPFGFENFD